MGNQTTRRYDIDWLRVGATYLLLLFHAAKVFDPMPFYHVRNSETSGVVFIVAGFISQWHMPLFFLLAGWSAVSSLRSRGMSGFLQERVLKLLVPLIAGCVLFGPLIKYIELKGGLDLNHAGLRMSPEMQKALAPYGVEVATAPAFDETFWEFFPTYFTQLERFTWGHLWFLAYLFTLSIIYAPLFERLLRGPGPTRAVRPLLVYLPIVPLVLIQLTMRSRWPGIYNLYNDWANLAFYSVFLWGGFMMARAPALEEVVAREWKRSLAIGTAAMLMLLVHALRLVDSPLVPLTSSAVASWCFVIAWVGFARERLESRTSPLLGYLIESAFPVYVLHQPVTVLIATQVVQLPLGIPVKFALLLTSSLAATLLVYHMVVRPLPPLRFILGMKPLACRVKLRARPDAAHA